MVGVVLAGGNGTRMHSLTGGRNKHSYEVAGRPMIYYPLDNLKEMGCDTALVVSSPSGIMDLYPLLQGMYNGMKINYRIQDKPEGSAQALGLAEGKVEGVFPVLCGDVYFDPHLPKADKPTLFWHEYELGDTHSVWNPETNEIIEKAKDIGKRAIVGYYYDERVFDVIRGLKPSERGELELVDLHRFYANNGAEMVEYEGFFGDMGTLEGVRRIEDKLYM